MDNFLVITAQIIAWGGVASYLIFLHVRLRRLEKNDE
jgi:hypothetical protein